MPTPYPVHDDRKLVGVVSQSLSGEYQAWLRHRFDSSPGNVHQLVGILPSREEAEARVLERWRARQGELGEIWDASKRNENATVAQLLQDTAQEQRMRSATGQDGEWQVVSRRASDGAWWVVD